jgi:hypothetical protein
MGICPVPETGLLQRLPRPCHLGGRGLPGWSRPASASAMRLLKPATRPGNGPSAKGRRSRRLLPLNAAEAARGADLPAGRGEPRRTISPSQNRTLTTPPCAAETRL